ncbi:MAG: SusC/RagA family TonB-linked outer membrane protein, partial [Chlamydiia bacterium]|nr:SusC/RagA family TonB-linked outer membrane protein [Chlamydiia bacterium]
SGVASGTSRKKMSVSVAKIGAEELNKVSQSSVSASLAAKVPGVTITSSNGSPGSGSKIQLRSATSLVQGSNPMILIDGVILDGSLADINVDDIANMEVVKGAAASALYGSRAANGVVVITTKRGSTLNDGQTSVVVRNEIGIQQLAKTIDLAEAHPYELAKDYMDKTTYTKYRFRNYPDDYVTGYDERITGSVAQSSDGYADNPFRLVNDLQRDMFTNGLSYTNYVGIGHRVNQTNMFVSFENNADKGIILETGGYKRQSFRANMDHSINENIKISVSNNYITTSNDKVPGGGSAFQNILYLDPDSDIFRDNDNGDPYNFSPSQLDAKIENPLYDLKTRQANSEKTRFIGSYDVNWRITDWMSFKGSYAVESQNYTNVLYTPKGSKVSRTSVAPGYYSQKDSKIFNQNYRATLNFNKTFGDLDFKAKLSYLFEDNNFESMTASANSLEISGLPSLNYASQNNVQDTQISDWHQVIRAENYFGIVSLVYKDRYIFDALYRRDGSSLFGPNVRWNDYYRVSGAYRISEDIKINGIDEMKVRSAYGTSGMRPGFSYQYETYALNDGVYYPSTLGNENLKPSRATELEIGLDISFLSRFRAELTYASSLLSDQFVKAPLNPAKNDGFNFQWMNGAEMKSNTFEAMLNAQIINDKDFNWDMTLTFDKTTAVITDLSIDPYFTGPRSAFRVDVDEEFGTMYGYDFVRTLNQMEKQLPTGKTIDDYIVNSDGVVVLKNNVGKKSEAAIKLLDEDGEYSKVKIGNITPDFRMGLNTTFSYKNLSLYMLWQWKNGGDIYNATAQYLTSKNRSGIVDQTGKPDGEKKTVSYYQSLYNTNYVSGYWVEDASFLRFKELSLTYNMNQKNLGKLGNYFTNIKMSVMARNLYTFTKYSGYDPEAGYSVGEGWPTYTFDNYGYPNFRSYSFSLEFKF